MWTDISPVVLKVFKEIVKNLEFGGRAGSGDRDVIKTSAANLYKDLIRV